MYFYAPVSMSALNNNINADLIMTAAHPNIARNVNTGGLTIHGGVVTADSGAKLELVGAGSGGGFGISVTDNIPEDISVLDAVGNIAAPYLRARVPLTMMAHQLYGIPAPTAAGDALPLNAWAAWTPTYTWAGGTPAGTVTASARWVRVGNVVTLWTSYDATDSNGCTGVTISNLPIAPVGSTTQPLSAIQRDNATWLNPLGYLNQTTDAIEFLAFATVGDGNPVTILTAVSYEVVT